MPAGLVRDSRGEGDRNACGRGLWCVFWFFLAPTLRPDDTPAEYIRKKVLVMAALSSSGIAGLVLTTVLLRLGTLAMDFSDLSLLLMVFTGSLGYLWILWWKAVSNTLIVVLLIMGSIAACGSDLWAITVYNMRTWPLFIIVIDILLICDMPQTHTSAVVAFVALWLVATSFESGFRLGLYDVPGLAPVEMRLATTACGKPPCPGGAWLEGLATAVTVFLLDFSITRNFSNEMRREKELLAESVEVAGLIAEHLARYDLRAATASLEEHAALLPPRMSAVLGSLITNLENYKPFLPDSLFEDEDGAPGSCEGTTVHASSVDHNASPRGSRVSRDSAAFHLPPRARGGSIGLSTPFEQKKVSLVAVAFAPAGEAVSFVARHRAALSAVYDAIKMERGSLDAFTGDSVSASFNAFRPAFSHSVNAVAMASRIANTARSDGTHADNTLGVLAAAVVSGAAHVGHLGTKALRSPGVVGHLPGLLWNILQAAPAVGETILCSAASAVEAQLQYPMRMLLHTFDLGRNAAVPLYTCTCVDRPVGGGGAVKEWMYELDTITSQWDQHNAAARAYHADGATAGVAQLQSSGASEDAVRQFTEELAQAKYVAVLSTGGASDAARPQSALNCWAK